LRRVFWLPFKKNNNQTNKLKIPHTSRGGSRERIAHLNLKIVILVFRGRRPERLRNHFFNYHYVNLSEFGRSSLCTAASRKEIFFTEVGCSALELMTKLISLTGF